MQVVAALAVSALAALVLQVALLPWRAFRKQ
jgi:hypothetical protein